jgi:histidyl-tRNA synthetase
MGLDEFVDIDLSIVRGLAYYTGIVFELFDANRSVRSICGGGRYDDLLRALGGIDLPAVGFGMGDVVITELLRSRSGAASTTSRLDVFLVAVTSSDVPEVLRLSHALRDMGIRVEYALKQQAVAKQLKIASVRRSRRTVMIGPDERESGEVVVRNMETGTEEHVPITALTEGLAWLGSREMP